MKFADGRFASGRRCLRLAAWLAVTLLTAGGGRAEPAPQTSDLRLGSGERAGEFYDLAVRFDDGRLLFAVIAIHNLGLGDRSAVAIGWLRERDGTLRRFSRSEPSGAWQLAAGGRRLEIGSIRFDRSPDAPRFRVDKNELGLDVTLSPDAGARWPDPPSGEGGCHFEVLAAASPAQGTLRVGTSAAVEPLAGWASLTHRWSEGAEAGCFAQRLEVFVNGDTLVGVFTETVDHTGRVQRWAALRAPTTDAAEAPAPPVVAEDGRALDWRDGMPQRLELDARSLELFASGPGLVVEPFAGLPAPLRWLLADALPHIEMRAASYAEPARAGHGDALVKLTRYGNAPTGASE